jgi:hypothetical protein
MFSETHKPLKPWFDTLKQVEPELDVVYTEIDQKECPSGEFDSSGWNSITKNKVKLFLDITNISSDESFIYSDSDVQFFNPFTCFTNKILKNYDIVFQNDYGGGPCTGFFFSRINKQTKLLFEKSLSIHHSSRDDQTSIQAGLKLVPDIKWAFLPKEFFTYGYYKQHWNSTKLNFKVPKNMIMHHANWVVGINNKIKLLHAARDNYYNNNFI